MTIGERGVDEDDENKLEKFEDANQQPELEVVTSSGRGKNGALCVLQHSIKPVMLTNIPFPGKNWNYFHKLIFFTLNFFR